MSQLATLCNVSKVTISRAFTRPELVRPQTREKIFREAARIGYTYNAMAGMVGRSSNPFVGIIVSHQSDSQFRSTLSAVSNAATANGMEVLLSTSEFDSEKELALIRRYWEFRAAVIIIFGPSRQLADRIAELGTKPTCPILVIGETYNCPGVSSVGINVRLEARELVQELYRLGHQQIALVCGPHHVSHRSYERLQGYLEGLSQTGLAYKQIYATKSGLPDTVTDLVDEGRKAMQEFLSTENRPTAAIFPSDQHALGAVLFAQYQRLRIPQDIAIVSMSESAFSHWIRPSIASLRLPHAQMSELALSFILDCINKVHSPLQYEFRCLAINGDSLAR